jgi:hypothetical protein
MAPRLWLALFWVATAAAQSVQGTVLNAATGAGIPGVKVELDWSGELAYGTSTDAQGRFAFADVKPGTYSVQYTAAGFEWVGIFQRPPEPMLIRVSSGSPVELTAHLMPMGRMSGHVVDPAGKPVPKAVVEVAGPAMQMNVPVDADGKFRIDRLLFPGAYTVSAVPPAGFRPPDRDPGDDRPLAWTRTWYPGATDPQGAGKIFLNAGASFEDVEIKLRTAPAHVVRGRLLLPDGKPASGVEVTLSSVRGVFKTKSADDGAFEFVAVDGGWRLSAQSVKLRAAKWIELAGRDLENLTLRLDEPISVKVRAIADVPAGTPAPRFLPRGAVLIAVDPSGLAIIGDRSMARLDQNGSAVVSDLYPRSYEIGGAEPPGYYLAEIRLGDTPIHGRVVELSAGATIALVFRADGGSIRGKVENCGDGGVLLVPQDPSARFPGDDRRVECDASGNYSFNSLRPGDYFVIAMPKTADSYIWNPVWSDGLQSQAASITVQPSQTVALDLKLAAQP